jgi:threonine dehydrogenase-like Zn-dependent dehydrogenase
VIVQVGYNSAMRLIDRPGRPVIVLGDGLIGQFSAQAALARGFKVLLAGRHDARLKLAKAAAPTLETINVSGRRTDDRLKAFLKGDPGAVIDPSAARRR